MQAAGAAAAAAAQQQMVPQGPGLHFSSREAVRYQSQIGRPATTGELRPRLQQLAMRPPYTGPRAGSHASRLQDHCSALGLATADARQTLSTEGIPNAAIDRLVMRGIYIRADETPEQAATCVTGLVQQALTAAYAAYAGDSATPGGAAAAVQQALALLSITGKTDSSHPWARASSKAGGRAGGRASSSSGDNSDSLGQAVTVTIASREAGTCDGLLRLLAAEAYVENGAFTGIEGLVQAQDSTAYGIEGRTAPQVQLREAQPTAQGAADRTIIVTTPQLQISGTAPRALRQLPRHTAALVLMIRQAACEGGNQGHAALMDVEEIGPESKEGATIGQQQMQLSTQQAAAAAPRLDMVSAQCSWGSVTLCLSPVDKLAAGYGLMLPAGSGGAGDSALLGAVQAVAGAVMQAQAVMGISENSRSQLQLVGRGRAVLSAADVQQGSAADVFCTIGGVQLSMLPPALRSSKALDQVVLRTAGSRHQVWGVMAAALAAPPPIALGCQYTVATAEISIVGASPLVSWRALSDESERLRMMAAAPQAGGPAVGVPGRAWGGGSSHSRGQQQQQQGPPAAAAGRVWPGRLRDVVPSVILAHYSSGGGLVQVAAAREVFVREGEKGRAAAFERLRGDRSEAGAVLGAPPSPGRELREMLGLAALPPQPAAAAGAAETVAGAAAMAANSPVPPPRKKSCTMEERWGGRTGLVGPLFPPKPPSEAAARQPQEAGAARAGTQPPALAAKLAAGAAGGGGKPPPPQTAPSALGADYSQQLAAAAGPQRGAAHGGGGSGLNQLPGGPPGAADPPAHSTGVTALLRETAVGGIDEEMGDASDTGSTGRQD